MPGYANPDATPENKLATGERTLPTNLVYTLIGRFRTREIRGREPRKSLRRGVDPGVIGIAVGTRITTRPPHKTGHAAFPHPASASGI